MENKIAIINKIGYNLMQLYTFINLPQSCVDEKYEKKGVQSYALYSLHITKDWGQSKCPSQEE